MTYYNWGNQNKLSYWELRNLGLCIVSVTRAFLGAKSIEEIINAITDKGLRITSETKAYLDENNDGS